MCLSKSISSLTPRKVIQLWQIVKIFGMQVYTWFFAVYRVSVAVGLCGYTALLFEFFGLAPLFMLLGIGDLPFVLLWYGLYFGILGRDCAEVASDWMVPLKLSCTIIQMSLQQAGVIGGRRKLAVQVNRCEICTKELSDVMSGEDQVSIAFLYALMQHEPVWHQNVEKTVQLDCKHCFHEFCIKQDVHFFKQSV